MKESKTKKLRDFIKSHEMRYFVTYSDYNNQTHIHKAFKVKIGNAEYWVHFSYGDRPEIKDEKIMMKTMDEAKAKAKEMRDKHLKEKMEDEKKRKAKLAEVTYFITKFSWWEYMDEKYEYLEPEAQPFAHAVSDLYRSMPRREKDDEQTYIELLERYIKTGTIYTQALAFRKEHIVNVKYGAKNVVQIELTNGTTIIPKSESVTRLINVIFGYRLDDWSFKNVNMPSGRYDEIKEKK